MNRLKLSPTSHRIRLCLLLFVMPLLLAAQKKLSGSVVDAVSGERLSFVMFYLASGRGTLSNFDGDFMLEIMPDDSVTITHVGYEKIRMKADLLPRIVRLKPMATQMAEVVVRPIDCDAILKKVIERLKKEHKDNSDKMSNYFMRTAYWDDRGKELVEAFADAFSAVNVSQLSINSGIKSVETADGTNRKEVISTNVHKILEAGPMTFDSRFWEIKVVPLNDFKKVRKLYDATAVRMDDESGESLYRINMKFCGVWPDEADEKKKENKHLTRAELNAIYRQRQRNRPPLLEGTLYIRQSDYALMRFDGQMMGQFMKAHNVRDTLHLDIHIQYAHDRGFTEVSHIAAEGRHPWMRFRSLLFNLHDKVDIHQGTVVRGNLLNAIQEAGYDSELWEKYDIVRRTKEEEEIAFGKAKTSPTSDKEPEVQNH